MEKTLISDKELPLDQLERIGLTREMVLSIPMQELQRILNGHPSLLLPLSVKLPNGEVFETKGRIIFKQGNEGVSLHIIPKLSAKINDTPEQFEELQSKFAASTDPKIKHTPFINRDIQELKEGKAVFKTSFIGNRPIGYYWMLDPATNTLMNCSSSFLAISIKSIFNKYHLTPDQLAQLRAGHPVEIDNDDEQITAGIDFCDEYGIRLQPGDVEEWKLGPDIRGEKYNFGINGCWIIKSADEMVYVEEENYDSRLKMLEHANSQMSR